MPNIAYIGGGGELAYWLQQKTTIEAYGANYPVLMLRNSVLWIDKATWQKCEKLGLSIEDLFSDAQNLATEYVNKHSQNTLDLSEQSQLLQTAFEQILAKALQIELDNRGNVKDTFYKTNKEKIFTAGDMRRGQSLVVWAISEGRECARSVDIFLTGESFLESKDISSLQVQV